MFAVETGVEQMVAERKESTEDERRNHHSGSSPVDMRHRKGWVIMGGSHYTVGEIAK